MLHTEHTEGSVRILRRRQVTEPGPWQYEISFAPYAAASFPSACDVVGDDQLRRALCFGLGLSEPDLGHSVELAHQGAAVVIHHIPLTDELKMLLDA